MGQGLAGLGPDTLQPRVAATAQSAGAVRCGRRRLNRRERATQEQRSGAGGQREVQARFAVLGKLAETGTGDRRDGHGQRNLYPVERGDRACGRGTANHGRVDEQLCRTE